MNWDGCQVPEEKVRKGATFKGRRRRIIEKGGDLLGAPPAC